MSFTFRFRRSWVLALLLVATLSLGVSAERAWVGNRGAATVDVWDTTVPLAPPATNTIVVGAGPIDMASDRADSAGPSRLFVACSGSSTISVIDPVHMTAFYTISTDSIFGSFDTPSGLARVAADPTAAAPGTLGPTIAMVDQKATPAGYGPAGRSTLRFISPTTNTVVDALRDPSGSARYNDVVFTSSGANRRLWIGDDGDKGVVAVRIPSGLSGPPFLMGNVITFGWSGIADFIFDPAATPAFLLAPRRLATNGTNRVVVADAASSVVTILDANYIPTGAPGEPGAVLQNVTLPAGSGTAVDVQVVGGNAYVTSTGGAGNLHRINLTTFAVTSIVVAGSQGGIGRTADGTKLFVGDGTAGATITQIDVATFLPDAPPFAFAGSMPFAFYSSVPATVGGGGPPGWTSTSNATSTSTGGCGLMGLEGLLLVGALLGLRRKKRA